MLDDFDGDEPLNIDPLEIEAMRVHFEMEVRKRTVRTGSLAKGRQGWRAW